MGNLVKGQAGIPSEPGSPSSTMLVDTFWRRLKRSETQFSRWRQQVKLYFRTYAGDPWPDGDKAALGEQNRVATNFNYALSTCNAVLGADQADRREARFEGVDDLELDQFNGEGLTRLVRHIYQKCNAYRMESQTMFDMLISGYGWGEAFVDSSRFPFRIATSYVDANEMYVDPDYKLDNCADARYVIRRRRFSLEDAIARWPEKTRELRTIAQKTQNSPFAKPAVANDYGPGSMAASDPGLEEDSVWVYDYQYRQKERWIGFDNPVTEKATEMPVAEFKKVSKELEAQGVYLEQAVEFARDVWMRAWIAGGSAERAENLVLAKPARILEDCFTYRVATGFRERDFTTGLHRHFGLMALIYEPQMFTAKSLSLILEILSRSAKGGGFIKANALEDPQGFMKFQSEPGRWFLASNESNLKEDIYERDQVEWPSAIDRMMQISIEALPQLSAVTDWVKGTAQQERSNVLISNLQSQSMVVLNPIMDPMSQYRVEMAGLVAKLAVRYMPRNDVNKVLNGLKAEGLTYMKIVDPLTLQEQEQPIPNPMTGEPITPWDLLQDAELFDFHIAVDLGAASVTAKQAIWQMFNQTGLLSKMAEIGFPMGDLFPFMLRNMPMIPVEQSKQLSQKIERQLKAQELQGTVQGVMQSLEALPADQLQQVAQASMQMLQQRVQQSQQQQSQPPGPPEQRAPAEGQPQAQ